MSTSRSTPSPSSSDLHGRPEVWLPRLIRLLDDQLADANTLSALSRAQAAAAAAGEIDEIVEILGQREPIVEAMTARGTDLEPFAKGMGTFMAQVAPRYRDLVGERITQIDALVGVVNQQDELDRAALERYRDRIATDLAGVGKARTALAAYGRDRSDVDDHGPRFQDHRG
ncbi:MAG: hypothetical protein ACT4PL_07165 [Phycisphaerales bacterium]